MLSVDASLDMHDRRDWPGAKADGAAAVSYPASFPRRFTGAQRARRDRIGARVLTRLAQLRSTPGAPRDETFVVHRTHADPRCLDLSLDANDRARPAASGATRGR